MQAVHVYICELESVMCGKRRGCPSRPPSFPLGGGVTRPGSPLLVPGRTAQRGWGEVGGQAGAGGQESLAVMVSKEVAGLGEDPTVLPPASVQQSCHLPMTPSLLKSFFLNSMDLRGHREGKNGVPAVLQKCLFCNCTLCGFAYLVKTVLMAPYLQGKRLER